RALSRAELVHRDRGQGLEGRRVAPRVGSEVLDGEGGRGPIGAADVAFPDPAGAGVRTIEQLRRDVTVLARVDHVPIRRLREEVLRARLAPRGSGEDGVLGVEGQYEPVPVRVLVLDLRQVRGEGRATGDGGVENVQVPVLREVQVDDVAGFVRRQHSVRGAVRRRDVRRSRQL